MNKDKFKEYSNKLGVDAASVVLFITFLLTISTGITTLYSSYYDKGSVPPEIFGSAIQQFSVSIGSVLCNIAYKKIQN